MGPHKGMPVYRRFPSPFLTVRIRTRRIRSDISKLHVGLGTMLEKILPAGSTGGFDKGSIRAFPSGFVTH